LDPKMADYFEEVAKTIDARRAASWVVDVLRGELNYRSRDFRFAFERLPPRDFAKILGYLEEERITEKGAVEVIRTKLDEGGEVDEIIARKGLFAIREEEKIRKICREVIDKNPKAVQDYFDGKRQAINFLVGQVMKETRGRADPAECLEIIKELLGGED